VAVTDEDEKGTAAARPETEGNPGPHDTSEQGEPILDALWKRALEAWDDDKPHHALLEYALRAQKLPEVAGRYRAIKDNDPEKSARAQKKIDAIVIAATQMLMAMKSPPDRYKPSPTITALFYAVSLVLVAWLGYAMFHRR
jgi:hypothetical protein